MNPWLILAFVAAFLCGGYLGHGVGVDAQKVADQVDFDRINGQLEQQKAQASAVYRRLVADNLNLINARDRAKLEQEKQREKDRLATEQLRNRLAGVGLRFAAVEDSGYWGSGGRPRAERPGAASHTGTTIVELPAALTADLRQLSYDADTLRDDYALLYRWAHSDAVKCAVAK